MAIKIDGDINRYIKLVGRSDKDVKIEAQQIIDELGCTPIIQEIDEEFLACDETKTNWLLRDSGVDFAWENDRLEAIFLYTQHLYAEYSVYSGSLFSQFSNTATRDDIVQCLGKPEGQGKRNQSWIRYNNPNGTWTNFEFDDDLRLRMVTICMPIG